MSRRPLQFLPIICASAYVLLDARSVYWQSSLELAYGAFLMSLLGLFLFAGASVPDVLIPWAVAWGGLIALHLYLAAGSVTSDFLGDSAVVVGVVLAVPYMKKLLSSRWGADGLRFYVLACVAAAVIAPAFATAGNRFEPPSALMIGAAAAFAASRNSAARMTGWLGLALSGILGFLSGDRTSVLMVFVALGLLALSQYARSRTSFGASIVVAVALGLAAYVGAGSSVSDVLYGSRFAPLLDGQIDTSSQQRIDEAKDAFSAMEVSGSDWRYVVGMGPGSGYRPVLSSIDQNLRKDGLVHSIHIGPVMMFFRFGLLGLVSYAALWWSAIRATAMSIGNKSNVGVYHRALAFSAVLILVDFAFRNATIEPEFALLMAGVIVGFPRLRKPGWRAERGGTLVPPGPARVEQAIAAPGATVSGAWSTVLAGAVDTTAFEPEPQIEPNR